MDRGVNGGGGNDGGGGGRRRASGGRSLPKEQTPKQDCDSGKSAGREAGKAGAGEGGKQRIRQRSKRQDGAHGGNNSAGDGAANSSSGAHEYGQKQQQLQQQNTPQAGSPDWVGAPGQQHNGSPQGDGARSPQSLTLPQQLSQALAQLQGRRAVDSELIPLLNPAIPPAVWREGLNQMCVHSLLQGSLHPECPERLAVHACGVTPGNAPFFSGTPIELMVSHPAGMPFHAYCNANRGASARGALAQQWATLDANERAPFEQQARIVMGVPSVGAAGAGSNSAQSTRARDGGGVEVAGILGEGPGGPPGIAGLEDPFTRLGLASGSQGGRDQTSRTGIIGQASSDRGGNAMRGDTMRGDTPAGGSGELRVPALGGVVPGQHVSPLQVSPGEGEIGREALRHGGMPLQGAGVVGGGTMPQAGVIGGGRVPAAGGQLGPGIGAQLPPLPPQLVEALNGARGPEAQREAQRMLAFFQMQQRQMLMMQQQHQQHQQHQRAPDAPFGMVGNVQGTAEVNDFGMKIDVSDEMVHKVSEGVMGVFQEMLPTREEMMSREEVVGRMDATFRREYPGTRLQLFGSSGNNFCSKGSDLDLCLHVPEEVLHPEDHRSSNRRSNDRRRREHQRKEQLAAYVLRLGDTLRRLGMLDVECIPRARVPIVKFKHQATPEYTVECDLCVNNFLACLNTELLRAFTFLDWRLRPLVYTIKKWGKMRQIQDTYRGYLSSYTYTLMVIQFLQRVRILPSLQEIGREQARAACDPMLSVKGKYDCYFCRETDFLQGIGERNNSAPVGMLLIQFFNFYSNEFNMKDQVVSIRKGCLISKRSKGWERPREKNRHVICIEDPFDVDVDLGRNVDEDTVEDIRAEFRRALEILITTGDVAALIQPWGEGDHAPGSPARGAGGGEAVLSPQRGKKDTAAEGLSGGEDDEAGDAA